MTKLEFEDYHGNYGYVEYHSPNRMDWHYEGDENEIYVGIFSQTDRESFIRPKNSDSGSEVDDLIDSPPEQKIRSIYKLFLNEGKIHSMLIDGERVF